ncbi:MAG: hypothetical protein CVV53_06540 [Spirochaetae bacterium HGW-Spirochaetae-9]|nr:MAG: hypothetical protein CVV53_06540 [Spirochaetae bacterium HGW-Spirochaetae-9]
MRKRIKPDFGRNRRKRDHLALIVTAVLLLYLIFAHRPLSQERTFVALGSSAPDTIDPMPLLQDETFRAKDRIFLFRPDQQGVTEMDASGKTLWSHEFGTLVTAASIGGRFSAWGLLDGSLQILDGSGRIIEDLRIETKGIVAAHPCIYGVAISENGDYIAALYGRDPQSFAVFVRNGQTYDLLSFQRMQHQVVSRQAAEFSIDGESVLVKTADGLAYFDIKKKRHALVHPELFSGDSELQILPFGPQNFAFLMARAEERFAGSIRKGSVEAFFPVDDGSRELSFAGDILTLRGGTSVQRFRLGLQ